MTDKPQKPALKLWGEIAEAIAQPTAHLPLFKERKGTNTCRIGKKTYRVKDGKVVGYGDKR